MVQIEFLIISQSWYRTFMFRSSFFYVYGANERSHFFYENVMSHFVTFF